MALDTAHSVRQPSQIHKLNDDALLVYLKQHIPSLQGPLHSKQFQHGQSNPTYLLEVGEQRLVLRKQPPGRLLTSAHAVDREYRVLSALAQTGKVPVPKPLCLCMDPSIIGTPFYIMEFAAGTIYTDPNLQQCPPRDRSNIYMGLADTLADLHSLNPEALGLQDFGNPFNYCRRQVSRWSQQYLASVPAPSPSVLQLIAWLQANVPAGDASPAAPAVVHGDFRLDNLVYNEQLQVIAVLDWELSTLGDPWADVAYLAMPYHLPPALASLCLAHPLAGGIPTEQRLLQHYCTSRGLTPPAPKDWAFYLALSIFRLLAILAGVQSRARQGNASSAKAAAISSNTVLAALADAALSIINRADSTAADGITAAAAGGAPGIHGHGSSSSASAAAAGSGSSSSNTCSVIRPRVAGLGAPSAKAQQLMQVLQQFLVQHVYPNEHVFEEHANGSNRWSIPPLNETLKQKARTAGLWNLWMTADMASKLQHLLEQVPAQERSTLLGAGLSHLDYAHLCAVMGTSLWAPELFNCSAPDTGNMEVLAKYGTKQQQLTWLLPLLRGHIRSCFAMTEKAVASSDATNITAAITRSSSSSGEAQYVVSGLKWWTSGAMDPRCKVAIFMGKTDPTAATHLQQSMIIVPMDGPGVKVIRPLTVFGYDDAPHGHAEVSFDNVTVPATNLLLGEGRGFEIAQGRLGPGRLHHCMRLVGMAERALGLAAQRALQRHAFGKPLAAQGGLREVLARQRVALEGARLLVLSAAHALDCVGHKQARAEIGAAKVAAPAVALQVIDAAIQIHGGAGVSQDVVLGHLFAAARTLRIADGPDEVHLGTLAKLELEAAAGGPAALKQIMGRARL